MPLYTRPQLAVLLLVVVTAGLGLGVGHWRRAHPELAARLERLDRAPVPPAPTVDDLPLAPTGRRARAAAGARLDAPVGARPPAPAKTRPGVPLDVNRASEDELRTLPGIGPVLAARIVEARRREGRFATVDDLGRVRGLGRVKLAQLAAHIALDP